MYRNIAECLCCGNKVLEKFFDLGGQPLANNLKDRAEDKDELYPLSLNVCKQCYHTQLTVSVDKSKLFKNYLYVSGTSNSLREYFKTLSELIVNRTKLKKASILDIACNDGTFLSFFDKYDWDIWGIDPAENLRNDAVMKGVKMYTDFFPKFKSFGTQFDVVTGLNVLAHTDKPLDFLLGCNEVLKKDGYIFIQTSQRDMIVNGEFDTVYHEHQSFFTIKSMNTLVNRAGMYIERVDYVDVHGRSFLFTIRKHKCEEPKLEDDNRYKDITYKSFQDKAEYTKRVLLSTIERIGLPVVGYGAAAKGIVLMNYLNLPLEYVIDDNKLKQNKIIGGVNIPVYSIDKLKNDKRDLSIVILAWNMYSDISINIKSVRDKKDVYIKPFPKVEVK